MEPLPTQGQTLRHYTASRPRPRRTHINPPSSRPQEPVSKVEDEACEAMGRVDEGVEEFFSKKIIPDYALKGQWEESNPAQATPPKSSPTPSVTTPLPSSSDIITSFVTTSVTSLSITSTDTFFPSTDVLLVSALPSIPSVPITSPQLPSKNIKKRFGDFFAFKRARAARAPKAGEGEGRGEGVKVKRTSIADLIRPLREAKERERERDKDREKEQGTRSVEDANISNDATITEGTIATSLHLADNVRAKMAPAKSVTTTTPLSETSSYSAISTIHDLTVSALSHLEEDAVSVLPGHTPNPVVTCPLTEQEMQLENSPNGTRRLKVTKRMLREGKSQSLILLTGHEPGDKDCTPSKKHVSESSSSFEHRLQMMLHRMGVAKTPPADTKMKQNKDEELRKAISEGAILDKPTPPPKSMKPRTLSTSSADPRYSMRTMDPLQPDPKSPIAPLSFILPTAAKLPIPVPAVSAGLPPSSVPLSSCSAEKPQHGASTNDSQPMEAIAQNGSQESPQGTVFTFYHRKEVFPPSQSPRKGPSAQDCTEKAQSVTEESLPRPRLHMKPLPQHRAVSVHEDALTMTQELKSVLRRSPVRLRGSHSIWEEAQGKQKDEEKYTLQIKELKEVSGQTKSPPPVKDEVPGGSSSAPQAQDEESQSRSPHAVPSALEGPPAYAQTLEASHVSSKSQEESPSTATLTPLTPGHLHVSSEKTPSTTTAPSESLGVPKASPQSHKGKRPGSVEGGEAVFKQAETTDQRTEAHPWD